MIFLMNTMAYPKTKNTKNIPERFRYRNFDTKEITMLLAKLLIRFNNHVTTQITMTMPILLKMGETIQKVF